MAEPFARRLIVVSMAVFFSLGGAAAEPLGLASGQGVLLLHNGEAVSGKITEEDDRYVVLLPRGEIRVKRDEVQHVSPSIAAAHQWLVERKKPSTAKDHVELAKWCRRYGLPEEARRHLTLAIASDPDNLAVARLEGLFDRGPASPPEAASPQKVYRASAAENLEQTAEALPEGAMRTFVRTVQPILLNHCATGGCHGQRSSQAFRLIRASQGRSATRSITLRNLHATLEWLHAEDPQGGLLAAAAAPHGGSEGPPLGVRQDDLLERLRAWAASIESPRAEEPPATVEAEHVTLSQTIAQSSRKNSSGKKSSNSTRRRSLPGISREGSENAAARDEFDAEIFNRRYHGSGPPAESRSESQSGE